MQVENAERWSTNQDHRSSWNSGRSKPIRPSGQGYEGQYSSQNPLNQQSHQVSQLYQPIQSPNNSRSQWANDGYGMPTPTQQPSSMSWTSHQSHTMAPFASVTSIHTVRYGWNAIRNAQLHQLATNTIDSEASVPLVAAVHGWSPTSSSNALDQHAEPKVWVSESATVISAADTNLNFGKMDNLNNSSPANQQKKSLSHPSPSSASFRGTSHFFESSCPSPTPSSDEHGSDFPVNDPDSRKALDGLSCDADVESSVTTVLVSEPLNTIMPCLSVEVDGTQSSMKSSNEMTDKITEVERMDSQSYDSGNKQPSLAQIDDKLQNLTPIDMAESEPDALDNDSVQKSEALPDSKLALEVTKTYNNLDYCGTNFPSSENKLDHGPIDTKGIELASPSTTPVSGPYEWNVTVDSTSGENQNDMLVASVDFLPPLSPTISDMLTERASSRNTDHEMTEAAADRSWEIAPRSPRFGAAAHGAGSLGWGEEAKSRIVSGVIAQGKTNVALGTAEQTSTKTGWTLPTMKRTAMSSGWGKPTVRNSREDSSKGNVNVGWGAHQKVNSGWEATMEISTGPESCWVLPATGYTNQNENTNTSWGMTLGSKNASWSSATMYHENVELNKKHGGDKYHEGSDSGYSAKYNPQHRNYFGGAGGSIRPPRGQGLRGVCKFYESGHCKKGASCNYLHPGQ